MEYNDSDIEEMYSPKSKTYINDAKKLALDTAEANEFQIIASLEKFKKDYDALLNYFFTTKKGIVKQLKKEISNLIEYKNIKKNYGIRKTIEVQLFSDYIQTLNYETVISAANLIELQVDRLYREEDSINRMIQEGAIDKLEKTIIIPPGYKTKVNKLTYCKLAREIWLEKPKHYIKNMSKEKAERFLSSAKKRANETGLILIETQKKLSQLKNQFENAKLQLETPQAKEENKIFNEKLNQLKSKLEKDLELKIKVYLKNSSDSKLKSQINKSLSNAMAVENKKNRNCPYVSSTTLLYLLNDIHEQKLQLPAQQEKL